jgi:hypothetical protein
MFFIQPFEVSAQKTQQISRGDFRFTLAADWKEKSNPNGDAWTFWTQKSGSSEIVMIGFHLNGQAYNSEKERLLYLEKLRNEIRKAHPNGFKVETVTLAGVETERWSYQDNSSGFVLVPFNNDKVYMITVVDTTPNVGFPPQAATVLSSLQLAGTPYAEKKKSGGALGALDKIAKGAEKLNKAVDKVLGADSSSSQAAPSSAQAQTRSSSVSGDFGVVEVMRANLQTNSDPPKQPAQSDALWDCSSLPTAQLPKNAAPVALTKTLNFDALNLLEYSAAITAAKEALRVIEGPMSRNDSERFEVKWAAYYAYPTREVVDYLNRVNPLLVEFIAARAGYNVAAQNFYKATMEAGFHLRLDKAFDALLAEENARIAQKTMDAYQTKMAEIVKAIQGLGEPPNPLEIHKKRQKRFEDEIAKLGKTKKVEPVAKKSPTRNYAVFASVTANVERLENDKETVYSFTSSEGFATGSFDFATPHSRIHTQSSVRFDPPNRLVPLTDLTLKEKEVPLNVAVNFSYDLSKSNFTAVEQRDWLGNRGATFQILVGMDKGFFATANASQASETKRINFLEVLSIASQYSGKDERRFTISVSTQGGKATYSYVYKVLQLNDAQANELAAKAQAEEERLKSQQKAGISQGQAQIEAAKQKADSIAYALETKRYFQERYNRDWQEYQQTTDAKRKQELSFRMMSSDANLHAADDMKTYLDTGQFVRTRTLYDDYDFKRMNEIGRQEAWRVAEPERIMKSTMAQIALLPEAQRKELLDLVKTQIDTKTILQRDLSRYRSVNTVVAGRVRSYWEGERSNQEAYASTMRKLEIAAQVTEFGAGVVVLGVGSAAFAEMGATAATLWAADTLLGASYGGATGYVQGGWDEATKRSLQWAGTVGFTASAAMDGFAETGTVKGAAAYGAGALLIGKALEGAGTYVAGWYKGKPSGKAEFNTAEFDKLMTRAVDTVRKFEKAEKALAEAVVKGTKGSKLADLEKEVSKQTAAINANWFAKFFLKHETTSKVGEAFDKRIQQVYTSMMPEVIERLTKKGYDPAILKFAPLRNPSSIGTVSMDLDMALLREIEDRLLSGELLLLRNGQSVSLRTLQDDAQKALSEAYKSRTGFTAEQSLMNMTTAAHLESFTKKLIPEKGKSVDWNQVGTFDRQRAFEVLQAKVTLDLPATGKLIEACRAMNKEMTERFFPDLKNKIAAAKKSRNTKLASSLEESLHYWESLQKKFKTIGKEQMNPQEIWYAYQEIQQETGKDVFEIAQTLGAFWEGLSKFAK